MVAKQLISNSSNNAIVYYFINFYFLFLFYLHLSHVLCIITVLIIYIALQDFILEHYSEDGVNYEEAIADLMETRQVSYQQLNSDKME